MTGGRVCRAHGGAARQVRRAAEVRALERQLRAQFDHEERRHRERLIAWTVDCVMITAEVLGIAPEKVVRADVWVARVFHPDRFPVEPERRRDRRFGPRETRTTS